MGVIGQIELPSSKESEQIVIGSLMGYKEAIEDIGGLLSADMFTVPMFKATYEAITSLRERGDEYDVVSVFQELIKTDKNISVANVVEMSSFYNANYYHHALVVADKYQRRKMYEFAARAMQNALRIDIDLQETLDKAKEELNEFQTDERASVSTMKEALAGVYKTIDKHKSGDYTFTGDPIGLKEFDDRTGGLQTTDLVIVAADTSMGKTSLAIKMAMNVNCPFAFYSMEMQKEQIAARMMSVQSGVSASDIQYHSLSDYEIKKIDSSVSKLLGIDVYFDDRSTSNIDNIISSIRSFKAKYNIHGAFIDYLQILNVNMKTANKEQQMGEVARRLKNLAKELDIWIVALSQLARNSQEPQPTLSRIRDSGQIAEASDMVILIYRPEVYGTTYAGEMAKYQPRGTALIDVAKGRNSGTFKFICGFNGATTSFCDLDMMPQSENEESAPF